MALLVFRLLWMLSNNSRFTKDHIVVLIFIAFLGTNSFLYETLDAFHIPRRYIFYFIHAFLPPTVISFLILRNYNWILRLIAAICFGAINYFFEFDVIIILIYYLAIWFALREGYRLSKRRSTELSRSVVYIAIAIDMFATMIILVLKATDFDWHVSQLIQYVHYLRLSIFLTTLIIMHVKLRRFIVA